MLVTKGPSWGCPWGGHAANVQVPWSRHLAPYLLPLSYREDEVKVWIHKGTENDRVGRGRTNAGGVCSRRACLMF